MYKFKVGDAVVRTEDFYGSLPVGTVSIVSKVDTEYLWIKVYKDRHNYDPRNFELHKPIKETKQETKQVGGTHYGEGVDVFDLSLQRKHDCLQHSAIKYIDRHKLKNGEEDIRKAISVLERILKEQYIEQETTK
tara:strand:- start:127 stop:528 length:402 start_codon:yes stop_codon:yes gene_type:complete